MDSELHMRYRDCTVEEQIHLSQPAGHIFLLVHSRIRFAFQAARAHCWLMYNFSSASIPESVSAGVLSIGSFPSLY